MESGLLLADMVQGNFYSLLLIESISEQRNRG